MLLKADLVKDRKFSTESIASFAQDNGYIGFFETSVKTNTNVNEAMRLVTSTIFTQQSVPLLQSYGSAVTNERRTKILEFGLTTS